MPPPSMHAFPKLWGDLSHYRLRWERFSDFVTFASCQLVRWCHCLKLLFTTVASPFYLLCAVHRYQPQAESEAQLVVPPSQRQPSGSISWWLSCLCWVCSSGWAGHGQALRATKLHVAVKREADGWQIFPPHVGWWLTLREKQMWSWGWAEFRQLSWEMEVSPPCMDPCSVHECSDISVSSTSPLKTVLQDVLLIGCGRIWHCIPCGPRHRVLGKRSQDDVVSVTLILRDWGKKGGEKLWG